jgi:hypothetical protein
MAKRNRGGAGTRTTVDTTGFEDPDLAARHRRNGRSDLFSAQIIKSIAESLPEPVCDRRCELLPQILREWSRNDLKRHLSMDSRTIIKERIERLELVRECARELSQAFDSIDQTGRNIIVSEMLRAKGRSLDDTSRSELAELYSRLDQESYFLTELAAIAPKKTRKLGSGRPRNYAAYLVLLDAAAIFEWFTGKKAARGVHRRDATETGPFFRFASVLWPLVFGKGIQGLPAAMKNWAQARSRYHEESGLIANIAYRHATWGVFEC